MVIRSSWSPPSHHGFNAHRSDVQAAAQFPRQPSSRVQGSKALPGTFAPKSAVIWDALNVSIWWWHFLSSLWSLLVILILILMFTFLVLSCRASRSWCMRIGITTSTFCETSRNTKLFWVLSLLTFCETLKNTKLFWVLSFSTFCETLRNTKLFLLLSLQNIY